jgi:outer membrane receptor protein involved in Fe transport
MWQYVNANQLSPRVSLTYSPIDGTTFHAGFARNFTPPAQVIAVPANTALFTSCPAPLPPTCTTVQAPSTPPPYYLMQPERSNVYDIGVVQNVLPELELGADVYLKMTRDQINQGQFGAALVLNGFQYERGQNTGIELKAVYTDGNLRLYANLAWARQLGNNVVTNQYLLGSDEFAYTQNNWVYADHSQLWTGSGGVSYLWNGTRFRGPDLRQRPALGFRQYRSPSPIRPGQCRDLARIRHSRLEPGHLALQRGQRLRYQLCAQERHRHRRVRQRVWAAHWLLFWPGAKVRAGGRIQEKVG